MLTPEALQKIDRELAKYPEPRSAIMAALTIAQTELGWLATATIQFIADYIKIPATQAMEVATFYSMYNLKPVGKYKLTMCTNLPCSLQGGVNAIEYLQAKLGIKLGETTADGKFTVTEGECMGACGDAPVMLVNNHKMCSFMTPDAIDKKLAELV